MCGHLAAHRPAPPLGVEQWQPRNVNNTNIVNTKDNVNNTNIVNPNNNVNNSNIVNANNIVNINNIDQESEKSGNFV